MLTLLAYRFPNVDILAIARLALLAVALVVGLIAMFAVVNLLFAVLWPVVVAVAGKIAAGGIGTMAFALVFRP